jgi:hypothetical protein
MVPPEARMEPRSGCTRWSYVHTARDYPRLSLRKLQSLFDLRMIRFAFSRVMRCPFFVVIGALVLTSCAGSKSAMADDLRSDLRSAISLASETDLFMGQIKSGRLLPEFRIAHADYLRGEARRQAREARNSGEKSNDAKTFDYCAEQLEQLARELASIRTPSGDKTLAEARLQVEAIREALLKAAVGQ